MIQFRDPSGRPVTFTHAYNPMMDRMPDPPGKSRRARLVGLALFTLAAVFFGALAGYAFAMSIH